MIHVRSWSSIALVSILTLNSGAALSKGMENAPISNASVQTEPVKMANIFRTIQRVNRTVNTVNQNQRREELRQRAAQRRQQQEIARQEALEKQKLEAERRRQYFESLTPEQQQAYIKEQRAAQARRDEAAASLLLMLFSNSSSGNVQKEGRYVTCTDNNGYYQVYVSAGGSLPDSSCS